MWRNWNPLNPPVNDQSGDEDNYESSHENEPDQNELVSPRRPHQSASASPRALLRPDPPPVEEVLDQVGRRLRDLPSREQRVANRNAHREAQEAAEAAREVERARNIVNMPPAVVDFEAENGLDGDKAQDHARQIKVEFDSSDIKFWFSQLENEMVMASIKSQWLKKSVLQRNLPNKQKEDVKAFLVLTQTEAGDQIYFKIKKELIRIYAPKPADSYKKALTRQMVGLPSQLGNQIVSDICKKASKLEGCCCAGAALALWSLQLPANIRAHISDKEFNHQTYKEVFEAADKVYLSGRQVTIAAVARPVEPGLDETLPAFSNQNQPQVAAVSNKNGSGGGGKKNKRNNRGGGKKNNDRGPKSDQNPPDSTCDRHYRHGDRAWYCLAPQTCPWKDKVSPKQ